MTSFKVTVWNVNSIRSRLGLVLHYLHESQANLLLVQETRGEMRDSEYRILRLMGYSSLDNPSKGGRAGTAIFYRRGNIRAIQHLMVSHPSRLQIALIKLENINMIVVNVYVYQGASYSAGKQSSNINSTHFDPTVFNKKLLILGELSVLTLRIKKLYPTVALIIGGDLNVVLTSQDVWHGNESRNSVSFTPQERRLVRCLTSILKEGFSERPVPQRFTWYDYRHMSFNKGKGMRIDYALFHNLELTGYDHLLSYRAPREWTKVSDHLPIECIFKC